VDFGLRDGGILRRDDLSRLFPETVYCVERECRCGSGGVGGGVWRVPYLSGREAGDCDYGLWIDVWDSGAVEEEYAAGDDDARTARHGERDCGEVFAEVVDRRQLKVESERRRRGERRCGMGGDSSKPAPLKGARVRHPKAGVAMNR
jgi:hypothetical protein